MGLCASGSNKVYIDGYTPYEYYQDEWREQLKETFGVLHLTPKQGYQIFKYFVGMDNKGDGEVTSTEFHVFFKITETPFSNRGKLYNNQY
jgi:hypothetical protein